MITPFLAFKLALVTGVGLTLGYFLVNITASLSMTKIQSMVVKRMVAKKMKQQDEVVQPKTKLCTKCKVNSRRDNALYCPKCQFEGATKF